MYAEKKSQMPLELERDCCKSRYGCDGIKGIMKAECGGNLTFLSARKALHFVNSNVGVLYLSVKHPDFVRIFKVLSQTYLGTYCLLKDDPALFFIVFFTPRRCAATKEVLYVWKYCPIYAKYLH